MLVQRIRKGGVVVDKQGADQTQGTGDGQFAVSAPSISLPKGGGAIRGIGEKFAANPVTGTGSMTVPHPHLARPFWIRTAALTYDSGSGNGPFGLGGSVSLPSITGKTETVPSTQL